MTGEQEILSKIAFINLKQKNYIGDGLDLTQGETALVSNEKCYNLLKDFPGKFQIIDLKDISAETRKRIYDIRDRLVEKDNGRLIFDTQLFSLLVQNHPNLKENSEKDFDNEFRNRNLMEIHPSLKKHWFGWIVALISIIAGLVVIFEYFGISP